MEWEQIEAEALAGSAERLRIPNTPESEPILRKSSVFAWLRLKIALLEVGASLRRSFSWKTLHR